MGELQVTIKEQNEERKKSDVQIYKEEQRLRAVRVVAIPPLYATKDPEMQLSKSISFVLHAITFISLLNIF